MPESGWQFTETRRIDKIAPSAILLVHLRLHADAIAATAMMELLRGHRHRIPLHEMLIRILPANDKPIPGEIPFPRVVLLRRRSRDVRRVGDRVFQRIIVSCRRLRLQGSG